MRRAALLALLGAAGCLAGPAPADHFYRLEADGTPPAASEPALAGTLEVRRFAAGALLSQRALLYRERADSSEIRRHAYHRWVEAPPDLLQRIVASRLREARAAERVVTPELRVPSDFVLAGRIARLEEVRGPGEARVVVELDLALTRTGDGRELLLQETYRAERETNGDAPEAAVEAMNAALAELLDRLVGDLASL